MPDSPFIFATLYQIEMDTAMFYAFFYETFKLLCIFTEKAGGGSGICSGYTLLLIILFIIPASHLLQQAHTAQ